MIKKIENCVYCNEKMESKTAKKKFCSDLHRLYYHRELKRGTLIFNKSVKKEESEILKTEISYSNIKPLTYDAPSISNKYLFDGLSQLGLQTGYAFGDDKYLVIEKYTKYPLKNKPTSKFEQIKWLKEKEESDHQIKLAWINSKKTNFD